MGLPPRSNLTPLGDEKLTSAVFDSGSILHTVIIHVPAFYKSLYSGRNDRPSPNS